MPSPSQLRLPPIQDEEFFEDLCRDLWASIWKDPDAQRNGRKGQKQHGVDVFGIPEGQEEYEGVQAKAYKDPLSDKQIQHEVDEAKAFVPPLKKLIIATTAPRDTGSQECVRQINLKHRPAKLFKVTILGWEDIKRLLKDFPALIEKYYNMPADTAAVREIVSESEAHILVAVGQVRAEHSTVVARLDVLSASLPQERYHEDLNYARDRINSNRSAEALPFIEHFRSRFWHNADTAVRYRIVHYTATAQFALGRDSEAAPGFIEALRYNPDNATALSFAALGHFLLHDKEKARELARKALVLDPGNARAHALLLQSSEPTTSFETLVESVPESYRGLAEVANALARCAHQRGNITEAEKWVREAIQNDTANWAEPRGFLGELLLNQATDAFISIQFYQLTPERAGRLRAAVQAFTDALAGGGSPDTLRGRAAWLSSRGYARHLLGETEEARQDLEEAARLTPGQAPVLYRLAMFLYDTGSTPRALVLLRKLAEDPTTFDLKLTLASMLAASDDFEAAQEVLREILDSNPPPAMAEGARHYQLQIALQEGDRSRARQLSQAMLVDYPQSVEALVDTARIELLDGNKEAASELLRQASQFVSDQRRQPELHLIATTWEAVGNFHEAAELYERIADRNADSHYTRRLLLSHYQAGNLDRALTLALHILSHYGPCAPYSEVAAAIYTEIGDLQNAQQVLAQYLAITPADFSMQLRRATIALRLNDPATVDAFLDLPVHEDTLTLEGALRIMQLRRYRGRTEDALSLAWRTRRRYLGESKAHLYYVMFVLELDQSKEEEWLRHDTVAVGTSVRVRAETGQEQWYLIDEQADPRQLPEELIPTHPLAQRLIGKTVGQSVVLVESPYAPTSGTIEEIQSKYVRALQESMVSFEQRFPGVKGLWSVRLRLIDGNEDEPDLQPFFDMLDQQSDHTLAVEQFYKEGKLTVGMFASLAGMHPLGVWGYLMRRKQVGVRCSTGNFADLQAAETRIGKDTILIPDVMSLCTLYNLPSRDKLLATGIRVGIAQTTLDLVEILLEERRAHTSKGMMTAGKEDGQYIRQELTPDDVQRDVAYFEELVGWIKATCTILPVNAVLKKGRAYRKQLIEMMDPSYVDTILLASEPGHLLYSDDERLRALTKGETGSDGIWTQPLLTWALALQAISEQEYTAEVIRLANSHYYHTHISSKVLLETARQAGWHATSSFTAVTYFLSGNQCDETSASAIVAETIYELWKQPLLDFHRSVLVSSLLKSYISGRDGLTALQRLIPQIRSRFQWLPLQENEVIQLILAWMRTQIL